MSPYVILALGAYAQLLPPLVGVAGDRLGTAPRRATALWCILLFAADAAYLMASLADGSNMWLGYVVPLASAAVCLWALSLWHDRIGVRRALRVAVPALLVIAVIMTAVIEDTREFSLAAAPFCAGVVLVAAAGSFLYLSLKETGAMLRQDWFWIVGGVMLYEATMVAYQPVLWYLNASGRDDLLGAVSLVRAVVDVLAFALIAGGLLCRPTMATARVGDPAAG